MAFWGLFRDKKSIYDAYDYYNLTIMSLTGAYITNFKNIFNNFDINIAPIDTIDPPDIFVILLHCLFWESLEINRNKYKMTNTQIEKLKIKFEEKFKLASLSTDENYYLKKFLNDLVNEYKKSILLNINPFMAATFMFLNSLERQNFILENTSNNTILLNSLSDITALYVAQGLKDWQAYCDKYKIE